jgi:hypothetical protein
MAERKPAGRKHKPPPAAHVPKPPPRRALSLHAPRWILAALFLLGMLVRFSVLTVTSRTPDETTYVAQAKAVMSHGMAGARTVVRLFRADPAGWIFPAPTRIGYTYPLAAFMKLSGDTEAGAGSFLACLASIAALGLAILLGLRFVGAWPTVFGALFLAVFPPELAIARRCWSDALVGLACLSMLYLTLAVWAGSKSRWVYALLPLIGSAAVLMKETSVLLYAPCLGAAVWAVARRAREVKRLALLLGGAAAGAALAAGLLAWLSDGLGATLQILANQARSNAANQYILEFGSGPPHRLLLALASLTPATTVLGIGGLAAVLSGARANLRHPGCAVLLAVLTTWALAPYLLVPHWQNLRFASAAFAPFCLFAGFAVYQLFLAARVILPRGLLPGSAIIAVATMGLLLLNDYQRLAERFRQDGLPDLAVNLVLQP